jgi:hypothetical protein
MGTLASNIIESNAWTRGYKSLNYGVHTTNLPSTKHTTICGGQDVRKRTVKSICSALIDIPLQAVDATGRPSQFWMNPRSPLKIAGDTISFETRTQTIKRNVLPSFNPCFAPSEAFLPSCTTSHYQGGERDRLCWQSQTVEQERISHLELHNPLRKDCIFPGELLQLVFVLDFPGLSQNSKNEFTHSFRKGIQASRRTLCNSFSRVSFTTDSRSCGGRG